MNNSAYSVQYGVFRLDEDRYDYDCLISLSKRYNLKMHWIEQLSEEKTLNCETLTHSWSSGDKDILQNLKGKMYALTCISILFRTNEPQIV